MKTTKQNFFYSCSEYCKFFIKNNLNELTDKTFKNTFLTTEITRKLTENHLEEVENNYPKEHLFAWFNTDVVAYYQYEVKNFSGFVSNPFKNPQEYFLRMVLYGVTSLLSQCNSLKITKLKVVLDENLIQEIIDEVDTYEVTF